MDMYTCVCITLSIMWICIHVCVYYPIQYIDVYMYVHCTYMYMYSMYDCVTVMCLTASNEVTLNSLGGVVPCACVHE